jgi:hypothetical protein
MLYTLWNAVKPHTVIVWHCKFKSNLLIRNHLLSWCFILLQKLFHGNFTFFITYFSLILQNTLYLFHIDNTIQILCNRVCRIRNFFVIPSKRKEANGSKCLIFVIFAIFAHLICLLFLLQFASEYSIQFAHIYSNNTKIIFMQINVL